jgi:hypothetical protein
MKILSEGVVNLPDKTENLSDEVTNLLNITNNLNWHSLHTTDSPDEK